MNIPEQTELFRFNISAAKYAIKKDSGWEVKPFFGPTKFSKEKNVNVKDLYGGGEILVSLVSDNGLTGALGLTTVSQSYERDMGRLIDVEGGTAEIAQSAMPEHCIYIETDVAEKGQSSVIEKAWFFGVTSQKANEAWEQNNGGINEQTIEYPLNIRGIDLQKADGSSYVSPQTGKTIKVFRMLSKVGDANYETFGDTVPVPTAKAGA